MTKVIVYDQLPGTGKSTRMIEKVYYVYVGTLDIEVVYVGMGKADRLLHLNSGTSHVYKANEAHFKGQSIIVTKVAENLSREEALTVERKLIEEGQPAWNLTYTDASRIERLMKKSLAEYAPIKNKSTNLHILLLALGRVDANYCFNIYTKEFKDTTNLNLAGWVANFTSAKGEHKFIMSVDKTGVGMYKLKLRPEFIENLEVSLLGLRLTNG